MPRWLILLVLAGCRATTVTAQRDVQLVARDELVQVFEATSQETVDQEKKVNAGFKGKKRTTKPSGEVVEEEGEWLVAAVEATKGHKVEQTQAKAEKKAELHLDDKSKTVKRKPGLWRQIGWWWLVVVVLVLAGGAWRLRGWLPALRR